MCTITFYPIPESPSGFILTQNRDESIERPAVAPKRYREGGAELYYPKDRKAGGTWIGVSSKKRLIGLMNGALIAHKHNPPYRKSRGVVVKELLAAPDFLTVVENYDFKGIEAFFALVLSWEKQLRVHELIWDGRKVFLNQKNPLKPTLWSSAMMYSPKNRTERKQKFARFLNNQGHRPVRPSDLWAFHHQKGTSQNEGMLIDRGQVKTTSVSQFQHRPDHPGLFLYDDLLKAETHRRTIIWTEPSR